MTAGPDTIIDAGPALTFLARKQTTYILFQGLGGCPLKAPEQVEVEVLRKCGQDPKRFAAVEGQWKRITSANRLEVLSDDETTELSAAVQRLTRMPMSKRVREQKDLGEILVIAHAAVRAEAGEDVAILIEERDGTQKAWAESERIERLQTGGRIRVWSTRDILLRAAGSKHLPDIATMKQVYAEMRKLDSALPPIAETELLTSAIWDAITNE